MYKYSQKTLIVNFIFAGLLIFLGFFLTADWLYKIVVALVALLILRDAFRELFASFEVTGDRLVIKSRDKVVKEITYRQMKYLTITRRNKKWIVIADDEGILFTIKPRIQNYTDMVADLIEKNKSNNKLEVHDYILKTYRK